METHRHYHLVSEAIHWMAEHQASQPELGELAGELGVSPHHLQRTFQAWAGVSPKQFLKSLTRQAAVQRLVAGDSVLDAALSSGLSGPGRLHDLMITTEALTPGQVRRRGDGVSLEYGLGDSPFGAALVAWSSRGISFLGFCDELGPERTLEDLRQRWPRADFRENHTRAQDWLETIFDRASRDPLPIWLRGSPFQLKVWEALLAVPEGAHTSYGRLAARIGSPGASRAVGSAVGGNPVAWLIPCHRVIRQLGELGGYHWGETTKQAMIGFEAAQFSPAANP